MQSYLVSHLIYKFLPLMCACTCVWERERERAYCSPLILCSEGECQCICFKLKFFPSVTKTPTFSSKSNCIGKGHTHWISSSCETLAHWIIYYSLVSFITFVFDVSNTKVLEYPISWLFLPYHFCAIKIKTFE